MKNFSQQQAEQDNLADTLSRNVIAAAHADDETVQAAADAPFLYQRVRAELAAAQRANAVAVQPRKFFWWKLTPALAGLASVLLIAFLAWQWQRPRIAAPQTTVSKNMPDVIAPPTPTEKENTKAVFIPATTSEKPVAKKVKAVVKKSARAPRAQTGSEQEITSDFMPLTYVANASAQGGQIVRVEMPRATLLALGIPIPGEPTREHLKADVLLNNEGLALAIRLVQ